MRKIPVVVHKEDLCFYRNNGILVVLSLFVGGMEGPLRLTLSLAGVSTRSLPR